jgi:hypothetical protein
MLIIKYLLYVVFRINFINFLKNQKYMIAYFVLALCLLILALFYFTKEYDSFKGIILVLLVASVIIIRSVFLEDITSFIYVPSTLLNSFIYTSIVTLFSVVLLFFMRKYNNKRPILLFFLYLLAGFVQQLLFQYVFLELVYHIIHSVILSILISTFYYALFHLKHGKSFFILTFIINIFWSTIYLTQGNLIPLTISHGILGTAYYTWLFKGDVVKGRSKIFRNILRE